jgi:hypothetical protein
MRSVSQDPDNLLRWDGHRRGWTEVHFLKLNDPRSRTALWIRFSLHVPTSAAEEARAELWGIFFDGEDPTRGFALKRGLPCGALHAQRSPFCLTLAGASLTADRCVGELQDGQHRLAWGLRHSGAEEPYRVFPFDWLYRTPFPRTKIATPHPGAHFSGRVIADGLSIPLSSAPGLQEHLWGTEHAHRWAWGHCSAFREDPAAVWEGLDAQVALGPLRSPPLKLFVVRAFGRELRFNRPLQWVRNRSRCERERWRFTAECKAARLEGELWWKTAQVIGVTYHEPDGRPLWCHNTALASARLRILDADRRPLHVLTCEGMAMVERGERRADPAVAIWL